MRRVRRVRGFQRAVEPADGLLGGEHAEQPLAGDATRTEPDRSLDRRRARSGGRGSRRTPPPGPPSPPRSMRRRAPCASRPARPRDAPVRDVADQHVVEHQLPFALDRRCLAGSTTRPLAINASDPLARRRASPRRASPPGQKVRPDHRRVLDRSLLVRFQQVDARRDDALHGVGELATASARTSVPAMGSSSDRPVLDHHPQELAREERVALGHGARIGPDDLGRSACPSSRCSISWPPRPRPRAASRTIAVVFATPPPHPGAARTARVGPCTGGAITTVRSRRRSARRGRAASGPPSAVLDQAPPPVASSASDSTYRCHDSTMSCCAVCGSAPVERVGSPARPRSRRAERSSTPIPSSPGSAGRAGLAALVTGSSAGCRCPGSRRPSSRSRRGASR